MHYKWYCSRNLNAYHLLQVGLSFSTISSVGPNAAINHYSPTPETNRKLTLEEIYLVDSGGQYFDGTTDVTRTLHFGAPNLFQKECFTRVLKGQLKVAMSIFPSKIIGNYLDTLARISLWEVGLDYSHGKRLWFFNFVLGTNLVFSDAWSSLLQNDKSLTNSGTGHGVGAYLNVHEGPMGIGSRAGETNGYPGLQLIPILNTYLL